MIVSRQESCPTTSVAAHAPAAGATRLTIWRELTKLKLTSMATLPAVFAFLAAPTAEPSVGAMVLLIFGVLASASGAAILNEWSEREIDSLMHRTHRRPLPAGDFSSRRAFFTGLAMIASGISVLALFFNLLAALLAFTAAVIYWLIYTPLKQKSPWCTEVGAVSGALPPLIGWAAAEGKLSPLAWIFFAILFLWQMPHFHPIAWRYRGDYARAGLRMRVLNEPAGNQAANHAIAYSLFLVVVTLLPLLMGYAGVVSSAVACGMGGLFVTATLRFRFSPDRDRAARLLFRLSLIYLPIVLIALTFDVL